jgi:hypothetical protein
MWVSKCGYWSGQELFKKARQDLFFRSQQLEVPQIFAALGLKVKLYNIQIIIIVPLYPVRQSDTTPSDPKAAAAYLAKQAAMGAAQVK